MKAAFVAGGGGYLGSKLCRELVRNGYSVTAFDLIFLEPKNDEKSGIINIQVREVITLSAFVKYIVHSCAGRYPECCISDRCC